MEASPAARQALVQTGLRAPTAVKFPLLTDGERAGAAAAGGGTDGGGAVPRMCIGSCPCLRHQSGTAALSCSVSPSPLRVPVTAPCPCHPSIAPRSRHHSMSLLQFCVPATTPRPCHCSVSPRALHVPTISVNPGKPGGSFLSTAIT